MLNFAIYSQLKAHLLGMSSLTQKLLSNAGSFCDACVTYLLEMQTFSDEHRLYISSDIAITLSKILTYKTDNKNLTGMSRQNMRKEKDAFAVACLESIHCKIKSFLEKDVSTYEECFNICRQVMSRAIAKGHDFKSINPTQKLEAIINLLKADPELLPYYAHVTGLIGVFNAQVALDSILPQLNI